MTTLDAPVAGARPSSLTGLYALYGATLLLSAALFFSLEPMFSKMILPVLGGSASVWSVAMVVFQALLLAGYVYAWALTRFLPPRTATLAHALVLALATLSLPVTIASGFRTPPDHAVSLWLVGLFVASIGLPCFALSANAPLLQAWFSRSGHPRAFNPYLLYGASNAGSFAVLLAYPFLIEPTLGLAAQAQLWSWLYWILLAMVCASGLAVARAAVTVTAPVPRAQKKTVSWRHRTLWIALGFIPSGLLVAVTAHIATDVASAPFLWVLPLALYLLTFIVAFAERPLIPERLALLLQAPAIALVAMLILWAGRMSWTAALLGNLTAFFVVSLVCQMRLYRSRPAASDLTEFYVFLSLGGVLGGIFSGLLAPVLFRSVLEYPLLAFATLAIREDILSSPGKDWRNGATIVGALCIALIAIGAVLPSTAGTFLLSLMALAVFLALSVDQPQRAAILAFILLGATSLFDPSHRLVEEVRSFYGVYKIVETEDGRFRVLFHGTTAHGAEAINATSKPEPLAYYYREGSFAEAIEAARASHGGHFQRVALVGLGLGALTCYAHPRENWTIYELDPLMVKIAGDRKFFRSLSSCGTRMPVVVGDGRLTLRASPTVDLLLLDIFASDAVPTHMLTREAFALFRSKLAPHGAIAFNISNHNMELASVVAQSAAANGMIVAARTDARPPPDTLKLQTEVAVVVKSMADLKSLKLGTGWRIVPPNPAVRLWTDDYSDVLSAILRHARS